MEDRHSSGARTGMGDRIPDCFVCNDENMALSTASNCYIMAAEDMCEAGMDGAVEIQPVVRTTERKPSKFLRLDLVLSVIAVFLIFYIKRPMAVVHPWEGLAQVNARIPVLILFILLSVVLWLRLLVGYFRFTARRLILQAALVLVPTCLFQHSFHDIVGATFYLKGLQAWAQREPDIEGLRSWGRTLNVPADRVISAGAWPPCVKKLRPSFVSLSEDGAWLQVTWGEGSIRWGLDVGPVNAKAPAGPPPGSLLPVGPGAYVWRGDR
jgi:hypothetical protein